MKTYSNKDFSNALINLGILPGDLLHVHNKLYALGKLEQSFSRNQFLGMIYEAYLNVIEDEGTLIFGTYTTNCGRFGDPFIYEKSPCMNGALNQYILERNDSLRSLHPINSFTAIGKLKKELCAKNGISNYGIDSPVERMLKYDTKLIFVGDDYSNSVLIHYVEQNSGLPYCYNKLLNIPVYLNDKKIDKKFTANVRYLDLKLESGLHKIREVLNSRNLVSTEKIGGGFIHSINGIDYYNCCIELVRENPFGLIGNIPNFVRGKIPFDGPTAGIDGVEEGGISYFRP